MRYRLDERKWMMIQKTQKALTRERVTNRGQKKIVIPEGTLYVGNKAFQNMTKLKNVVFSKECRIIGRRAFENCTVGSGVL